MNVERTLLPAVFLVSCISLWGITGCSKSNSNNNASSNGSMTCSISGSTFTPSLVFAGYLTSYSQIIIQGDLVQNKDTAVFQVTFPYIPPVNHAISTDTTTFEGLTYVPKQGTEYDAYYSDGNAHAVITLTAADTINHKVTGNFSGVLYNALNSSDSVVVANGSFTSSYTVQ